MSATEENELDYSFDLATDLCEGPIAVYIQDAEIEASEYIRDNADVVIRHKHLVSCMVSAKKIINTQCPIALLGVLLDKKVIDISETNYSGMGFSEPRYEPSQSRINVPFYLWFNFVIAHNAIYTAKNGVPKNIIEFIQDVEKPFALANYYNKLSRAMNQIFKRYILDEF